jgi:hypothetical protein
MKLNQELFLNLKEHPKTPSPLDIQFICEILKSSPQDFHLHYKIIGDLKIFQGLNQKNNSTPLVRKEDLWKKTCFEFFWSPLGTNSTNYVEWNFTPEREWDIFYFHSYRNPIFHELQNGDAGIISIKSSLEGNTFILKVHLFLSEILSQGLKLTTGNRLERANVSSILVTEKNEKHYFAKMHKNADKPDFHLF